MVILKNLSVSYISLHGMAKRIFPLVSILVGLATELLHAQTIIGGLTPDGSAILEIKSTSKGVLFPRMTTAQRDNINPAATGLMIFNTSTYCLEINLGSGSNPYWERIKCGVGLISSLNCNDATLNGTILEKGVAASGQSISVPYTNGNGFLHDGQTVNSTGVTGLTATLTVDNFALGAGSVTYNISGTGSAAGLANFALNVGGQSCTLIVPVGCGAFMAAGQWKEFKCYNEGAANTSSNPFSPSWEIIGDYWQWGKSVASASGPSSGGSNPNDGVITPWPSAATADAWMDNSKTLNDPCPPNFRVPTQAQFNALVNNSLNPRTNIGTWTSGPTQYGSGIKFGPALFLPAAGSRFLEDGSLVSRGAAGYYTSSSTTSTDNNAILYFNENGPNVFALDY